jgi:hypothetical protein
MKNVVVSLITAYQKTIANILFGFGLKGNCRFSPTCSEYAKLTISEKGFLKGSYLSIVRLLKCQPFYNGN